ncbi:CidA/LrgA family protein [Vreelandella massiliensis]|uniref:CidA/LrgA family protein n=1 Tax=Vreelandella massiliensis TaxID=1816686 RepID=UPI00096ABB49|nr:CidA/LrgA family protein [Halomonas massiliensis]MYL22815.1 CidA/LrgA family protein [Halomonas alkaliantarctica]
MVQGFLILLLCQLIGEWLMVWLGIPVPGPVAGMILLLLGLTVYGRVPEWLRPPAEGLIRHLSLLFVPAGVGLMVFADVLAQQWLAILASLLLSTFITLFLTAWIVQTLEARQHK